MRACCTHTSPDPTCDPRRPGWAARLEGKIRCRPKRGGAGLSSPREGVGAGAPAGRHSVGNTIVINLTIFFLMQIRRKLRSIQRASPDSCSWPPQPTANSSHCEAWLGVAVQTESQHPAPPRPQRAADAAVGNALGRSHCPVMQTRICALIIPMRGGARAGSACAVPPRGRAGRAGFPPI